MARPRKSTADLHAHTLRFTVPTADYIRIQKAAARAGVTVSQYLRERERSGQTIVQETRTLAPELFAELRRIGVNLNQAVHHMNAGNIVQGEDMKEWLISANDVIVELDEQYKSLCRRAHQRAKEAVCAGAT